MRTFEERTRLIHKRTEELRQKEWKRKQAIFDAAAATVCLILVVGVSLSVAEMMNMISTIGIPHTTGAASIIGNHVWLGYVVISIFSFSLGVSLTVLLYRLHQRNRRRHQSNTKSTESYPGNCKNT